MTCTLCQSVTQPYKSWNGIAIFRCQQCHALIKDTASFPSLQEEKERYDTHNNDVHAIGYQTFVNPIVQQVKLDFSPEHNGLDYGCGPGPVITHLLNNDSYSVQLYDPIYAPDLSYKNNMFDFIVCCEVAEHFHQPNIEFASFKKLLKPSGKLYLMTALFNDSIDFDSWYYKNDNTHVIFYTEATFAWIQKHFGFSELMVDGSLIVLTN